MKKILSCFILFGIIYLSIFCFTFADEGSGEQSILSWANEGLQNSPTEPAQWQEENQDEEPDEQNEEQGEPEENSWDPEVNEEEPWNDDPAQEDDEFPEDDNTTQETWWNSWNTSISCPIKFAFNVSTPVWDVQISSIKSYWNNQIINLKNKTKFDVDLSNYYIQFLDWTTVNINWNTISPKWSTSLMWNYWIPTNTDFCINLIKYENWDEIVQDRYCRNSISKANSWDIEKIQDQPSLSWQDNPIDTWNIVEQNSWDIVENNEEELTEIILIKIINIDYDPEWVDGDNESIVLQLLSWWTVDLSKYSIYYTKDWNTKKIKKINSILSWYDSQKFMWGFSFPNSTKDGNPVVVNLVSPDWDLIDSYIYDPNTKKDTQTQIIKEVVKIEVPVINYSFSIDKVVYDPEWTDDGNEEIWITSQNWDTVEFGSKIYISVNWTRKSLKSYWSIKPWETKKLVWTFGLPNSKKTTIDLIYSGIILDTYEYDPEIDKLVDTGENLSTWEIFLTGMDLDFLDLSIISVLPNPFGADESNEEISLYYSGDLKEINLSSWFYLQIGTTKKYLKWILPANQETAFKWSYSLPNKWWCVEIWYKWNIFDKFCYEQPYEWQKFFISNWVLESLNTLDLSVLNKTKMQNIWNKVCMTYWDQKFSCKNMPYSKLSTKRLNQNKLYKEFFDSFENYLKSEWKIMYYDSEIKNYFSLLNDIEGAIADWNSTFDLNGQTFQTSEFQAMYDSLYKKEPQDFVAAQLDAILPNWVVNKYFSLKQQYLDYLFSI